VGESADCPDYARTDAKKHFWESLYRDALMAARHAPGLAGVEARLRA
jgi:hypothetical protein